MKTYSQNQEDIFISKYFGDFKGRLLDIGANDGVTLSNSRLFIERGWVADLVEPDKKAYSKLLDLYYNNSNVNLCNVAISDKTGVSKFYSSGTHLGKGDTSLLSSLSKDETKRWRNEVFKEIEVRTETVSEFLGNTAIHNPYDFISIDAEGYDLIIFNQIYKEGLLEYCKCLCVEHNGSAGVKNEINAVMKKKGFRLGEENGENFIFIK